MLLFIQLVEGNLRTGTRRFKTITCSIVHQIGVIITADGKIIPLTGESEFGSITATRHGNQLFIGRIES